ncbi:TPA: VanZ family protein [Clostridioides difficile]
MEEKKQHSLTMFLFAVYFCILIWVLLFKMSFSFEELDFNRSINVVPFSGSTIVNGKIYINEIINNILVFVPVGIYTCMLKQNWSIIKKFSVAFFISFIIEVLQYVFAIGSSDITDLIGNTIGGAIGVGIFYFIFKVFKNKTFKLFNILASIATVGLGCFISILLLA